MKKRTIYILITVITVLSLFTMCEKDPPKASFTHSSDSYEAGDTINFTNTTSEGESYEWTFGDGSTSTEENPWHIFNDPGNYEVTLTATNNNGSNEAKETITVREQTILAFYVTQDTTDNAIENCSVILYDNQSDWEDGINEVAADYTDADGLVIFYHAKAIVYYIYALKEETGGAWFFAGYTGTIDLNEINVYTVPAQWISNQKASRGNTTEQELLKRIE